MIDRKEVKNLKNNSKTNRKNEIMNDIEYLKVKSQEHDLDCLIKIYLTLWTELKSLRETEETEILEKLLFKMQLNFFSLFVLLKGNKCKNLYDVPSIFTLTRTLIENYVTFEYLFVIKDECLKHTSREERIRSYKFAGYNNLKQIEKIHNNSTRITEIEKILEKLKLGINISIEKSENVHPKNFERPRMEYCWADLIEKSKLHTIFFKSSWKLFANYAHSEYVYIKGINNYISNHKAFNERRRCYRATLIVISLLISTIVDLYPDILKEKYEKIENEKRSLISSYVEVINKF